MYRDYNCPRYKKFRLEVLKRDGFKCKWPKCKARKKLQVHHISGWSSNPWLRYYVGNGITLCKTHHNNIKNNEVSWAEYFMRIINGI